MKCQFCQKPCRMTVDNTSRYIIGKKYYRCDYHGAVVVKHIPVPESFPDSYSQTILAVLYRDATYEVSLFYGRDDIKFRIDKINISPKTIETIITLDFHPDITPENIAAKLPTYILFS